MELSVVYNKSTEQLSYKILECLSLHNEYFIIQSYYFPEVDSLHFLYSINKYNTSRTFFNVKKTSIGNIIRFYYTYKISCLCVTTL